MLYADYIRKKMHNLAKIITASGYPLKIISKFKQKAVDYKIYGKTEVGKNLIPYPYTIGFNGQTEVEKNGITFTDNGDGSITANGTATANAIFYLVSWKKFSLPNSIYTVTGCPSGGGANKYYISIQGVANNGGTQTFFNRDFGTGVMIDLQDAAYDGIETAIEIKAGMVCDNLVFYPMLELGKTASSYESYTETGVGDDVIAEADANGNNYKIPIVNNVYGNEMVNIPSSKTYGNCTVTNNGNGTVSVVGTNDTGADAYFNYVSWGSFEDRGFDKTKKYLIKGGNSDTPISIALQNNANQPVMTWKERGNGTTIDLSRYETAVKIAIFSTAKVNVEYNSTFAVSIKEILNKETTVIYTNTQLKDGESISFKADDLPQLQLYKGENNITVDTEVEPSEITVKYKD